MSAPTTRSTESLDISLEPHLLDTLRPLSSVLPPELAARLQSYIAEESRLSTFPAVPYALLSSISAWSRSSEGERALRAHVPALQQSDYTMIALLAGTRTSPGRKFPPMPVSSSQSEDARRKVNDRRAITAILNALLSIIGSGVATWWAAGRLDWKDEWRVLLSLFVAAVVAISEAILYTIWDARRSNRPLVPRAKVLAEQYFLDSNRDKKEDAAEAVPSALSSTGISTSTAIPISDSPQTVLRERIVASIDEL
ncbi:uncharacterized protein FIBRA_07618 [Fibroporia radiculosa]|uniref:Uncharacterized protein n=1 Tax=Fibroporia radiculosa TaxID=599839 RepID=J4I107_9APHY|nr:uncharacterized protein FIBRA_07618 [Fibroporia radiculosa]CCM05402.1 predicted protein [Fibroporia radiculosa]